MSEMKEKKLIVLDKPNINNRIYSTETITKSITDLGEVYGCLEMPLNRGKPEPAEISHVVENLQIKDGFLVGNIRVLDTEKGKLLRDMLDAGISTNFRTAGVGLFVPREDGVIEVTNFTLMSVNLVYTAQWGDGF